MVTTETPLQVTENIVRSMLSPIVKVLVGEEEQVTFNLHSALLCQKSEYFRASLQGKFSEAIEGEVRLPDTDPETFQYFVKWLYTGDLLPFHESIYVEDLFDSMVGVYVLGDRIMCDDIRNRAVDVTQEVRERQPFVISDIIKVAKRVGRSEKLMQYIVAQLACDMVEDGYHQWVEEDTWLDFISMDSRMTTDLMCKLKECQDNKGKAQQRGPATVQGCRWHDHANKPNSECRRWPKRALLENEQ